MSRFAQGVYKPLRPEKYVGKRDPRYRSGWELAFMRFCDNNDHILQWASESISIPYRHPFTGKMTMYVPDFLITYVNRSNQIRAELIEIKPRKQSVIEGKMKEKERMVVAINYAKWAAANAWCSKNGLHFRVLTEDDIFRNGNK